MINHLLAIFLLAASPQHHEPKIIGGEPVPPQSLHQYDFYAELHYGGRFVCGGSVIGDRFVLTAAHCMLDEEKYGTMAVYVAGTEYAVSDTWHMQAMGDVALVVSDMRFPPHIRPLALNGADTDPADGEILTAAGKGRISSATNDLPPSLYYAELPAVPNSDCNAKYWGGLVKDNEICAGGPGLGVCNGDSGGPLWDPSSRTLIGVTSWGERICAQQRPGVFARVSSHAFWLQFLMEWFSK